MSRQLRPFGVGMRSACYFYNDVALSLLACSAGRFSLSVQRAAFFLTQPREAMAEQASGSTRPPQHDGKRLSPQREVYCADLAVFVVGLRPVRPRISQQQSTG